MSGALLPRPELGDIRPFEANPREINKLDNGMEVSSFALGRAPLVFLRLNVRNHRVFNRESIWLERFSAQYLNEGGAGSYDPDSLAREFSSIGGQLHISADEAATTFSTTVPSENLSAALNLLGLAVKEPTFPEQEAERIRDNLLRELELSLDQPQVAAAQGFRNLVYGDDHHFGNLLPQREYLQEFGRGDALNYWSEQQSADRAHIYVSGQFDREVLVNEVESNFSNWKVGGVALGDLGPAVWNHKTRLFNRDQAEQSTIYMGLPVISPGESDWIALEVLNALLGGSFHSRITLNIREDKGYTYSPRSALLTQPNDGIWLQMADVTTDVTAAAIKEILFEISRIRTDPPELDELQDIKQYMVGSFIRQMSEPVSRMGHFVFSDLHGISDDEDDHYIEQVMNLQPEDIRRTAETYLDPSRFSVSIAGDIDRIKDSLSSVEGLSPFETAT